MQIGFNLLVVGGAISPADRPVLESLKRHGYDGVEVPVMGGTEADCAALGRVLDELGLARTYTTIIPDPDHSPMSADPGVRRRARDRLAWAIDCGHALGATVMGGPYHSPLGVFSGSGPTEDELANLAEALHWAAGRAQEAGHPPVDRGGEPLRMLRPEHDGAGGAAARPGRAPEFRLHVRHLPRQHRGARPGRRDRRAMPPASPMSICRRTTAASPAAAMSRSRRPCGPCAASAMMAG